MPHALTYDTLPPHSGLRREIAGNVVTITAAAGEPGTHVRRLQLHRSALSGALLSGALLLAFMFAASSNYLANRRSMDSGLFAVLVVAFAVLCIALFLFIWRAHYAARLDVLEKAFRQTTILAASPGRLLIETAGPFGQASHDLSASGETAIVGFRRAKCAGEERVHCLEVVMSDGSSIQVLPGRDEAELNWVARTLQATLSV